jgi:probable F420-dependent oxidoreductase
MSIEGVMVGADTMSADRLIETCLRLESLGYRSVWIPDMYGREIYVTAGAILGATTTLKVASGIAHMYGRDPIASAQAGRTLSEFSGGRFIQGLGVSHPIAAEMRGLPWENPVEKASGYLKAMRGETPLNIRASAESVPLYLAAHGPKMLGVAAEYADGANIYMQLPEYMSFARQVLGAEKRLNVVLPCCLTDDPSVGRAAGRAALSIYLPLPAYQRQWAKQGFDVSDWSNGGSDRLVDAYVPWGNSLQLRERMSDYLASGASAVVLSPMPADPRDPESRWETLHALAPE